jgi:hypothetical protein
MNQAGYEDAFHRYERAKEHYEDLQEEVHAFLMRFTGAPDLSEAPFVLRDLARMEGLRMQRDDAFKRFTDSEREIFDRLGEPWESSALNEAASG